MADRNQSLVLLDGRTLSYATWGDPAGPRGTALYHHGFPGSREEALVLHEAAARHGIRLVAVDRPGMGRSSFLPARTLLDWPDDLLQLASHLQVDRFVALGVSGGGPYAIAAWNALSSSSSSSSAPESSKSSPSPAEQDSPSSPPSTKPRCVGAAIVSGLYPASVGHSGMARQTRQIFFLAAWSPWLTGRMLDWVVGAAARESCERADRNNSMKHNPNNDDDGTPSDGGNDGGNDASDIVIGDTDAFERYLTENMNSRPGVDRDVMAADEGHGHTAIRNSLREAFRQGSQGPAVEAKIYGSPWGFELKDMQIPAGKMVLWHGSEDINVPLDMARDAAPLMRGAELRVFEGEGHFSLIIRKADEIMETVGGMFSN